MGEHARVVGKAPRHMTGRSALPLIFGLALLGVGSGCSIESGGRGKPLEARAVGGTERVEEEGQVFLQLRQCPAGQLLLATETGWECGVLDRSGLVTEVQAGDGIQVKPEGAARRVSTAFAGSGGEAGLAPTVARSDHTHAPEAITGLTEALDSKADQAWVENELVKKANVGHTHVTDDVIGLPEQLATKADQTAVDTALAAMAPLEHVHDLGDIEGLEQAIASVAQATIEAGVDWRLLENVPAVWPGTIAWEHIDQRPDVAALQQAIAALQTQVGTLESQVQTLQQQRLADAVCPQGWEEARDPRARVCRRRLPDGTFDEMVRIGDFLIDRYEASLLNGYKLSHAGQPDEVVVDADCDWEQFRDSDLLPFCLRSVKGVDITGIATSVPRKRVLHTVTWFQAQALCVNAGKRLCTNDEWQVAALGTPDPADPTESLCNIADALPLEAVGHPDAGWTAWGGKRYLTGASPGCVSERGVYDLVGNVWEWVAWWAQAGSAAASVPAAGLDAWPAGWGGDRTYNVNGRANDGTSYRDGLPAAGLRGGGWDEEGTPGAAGVYSLSLSYAPTAAAAGTGFRCCRGGI